MMGTKTELQDRRRRVIHEIVLSYNELHPEQKGDIISTDLTPYCIRVFRRIRRWGRVRDEGCGQWAEGFQYTGAQIAILDIHFTSMRYHALQDNTRGEIGSKWTIKIHELITKLTSNDK